MKIRMCVLPADRCDRTAIWGNNMRRLVLWRVLGSLCCSTQHRVYSTSSPDLQDRMVLTVTSTLCTTGSPAISPWTVRICKLNASDSYHGTTASKNPAAEHQLEDPRVSGSDQRSIFSHAPSAYGISIWPSIRYTPRTLTVLTLHEHQRRSPTMTSSFSLRPTDASLHSPHQQASPHLCLPGGAWRK